MKLNHHLNSLIIWSFFRILMNFTSATQVSLPFEILTGLMLFIGGLLIISFSQVRTFDLTFYARSNVLSALLVIFEIIVLTSIAYFINIWTLKKLTPTIVTFLFIYNLL